MGEVRKPNDELSDLTILESASRFWLSAHVFVACITLALLAVSIGDSRTSVANFPATLNSSCVDSLYLVQNSVAGAFIGIISDAQNTTNVQYQNAVVLARKMAVSSLNVTLDLFLLVLKQIDPLLYCALDGGIDLTNSVKASLSNLAATTVSCDLAPIYIPQVDYTFDACADLHINDVFDGINDIYGNVLFYLNKWPEIPDGLTGSLDDLLSLTGFTQDFDTIANFEAPPIIFNINATQIIDKAMVNTSSFRQAIETCHNVSVQFTTATQDAVQVMYYVEVAIWLAIVLMIVGIFVHAVIQQFPIALANAMSNKMSSMSQTVGEKADSVSEKVLPSKVKVTIKWLISYISYKPTLLTTCYGLLGFILVYGLIPVAGNALIQIDVWVDDAVAPGMARLTVLLQDALDESVLGVQSELNTILQFETTNATQNVRNTLADIIRVKAEIEGHVDDVIGAIGNVSIIGGALVSAIECVLPLTALKIVDLSIDSTLSLMTEFLNITVAVPSFTLPNLAGVATNSLKLATVYIITSVQTEFRKFEIIFIILSFAIVVLLLQGLFIICAKKGYKKYRASKKQRKVVSLPSTVNASDSSL